MEPLRELQQILPSFALDLLRLSIWLLLLMVIFVPLRGFARRILRRSSAKDLPPT
jgi:hypothetical protein